MTDYTEQEIERLHVKLANIYRRGELTRTEKQDVRGLWARIERLQSARNKMLFRETGGMEQ